MSWLNRSTAFNFIANLYKTNAAEYNRKIKTKNERKTIPAANKSFSGVDVNCTIVNWQFGISWAILPEPLRQQTDIIFYALHGATTGIIFTYSFFELVTTSSFNWAQTLVVHRHRFIGHFLTQTQELQRSEWSKQNWQRKQREHLNGFQFSDWLVAKFSRFRLVI